MDGKRIWETFKSESEVITRAWKMHDDRQQAGKAGFALPMNQRVEAAAAFKLLTQYPDATLKDAVAFYIERRLSFVIQAVCSTGSVINFSSLELRFCSIVR